MFRDSFNDTNNMELYFNEALSKPYRWVEIVQGDGKGSLVDPTLESGIARVFAPSDALTLGMLSSARLSDVSASESVNTFEIPEFNGESTNETSVSSGAVARVRYHSSRPTGCVLLAFLNAIDAPQEEADRYESKVSIYFFLLLCFIINIVCI